MSDVTRRELFGMAAVGALGLATSGCNGVENGGEGATSGSTAQGGAATPAPGQATGAKPYLKIAVQGLTVIHRDYKAPGDKSTIVGLRLAPMYAEASNLPPHVAIFAVPQANLVSWEVPPLVATMDYVFWAMKGWKARLDVTSGTTAYSVGGTTKIEQYTKEVTAHDCESVKGSWKNASMIVNFKDVGVAATDGGLKPNWQDSEYVAGYVELPYGFIEDQKVKDGRRHEEFDRRVWKFAGGTGGSIKRALKNVVRIQLPDVDEATLHVKGKGSIKFKALSASDNYDPDDLPVLVTNFANERHDPSAGKHDFQAYYDILKNPPTVRPYPREEEKCLGDLRFSVECGCCPPLGTDFD